MTIDSAKPSTCCGKGNSECVCGKSLPLRHFLGRVFSKYRPVMATLPLYLGIPVICISKSTTLLAAYHSRSTSSLRVLGHSLPFDHISNGCHHTTAKQATCSCGKTHALHCNCERAPKENAVEGPRCSCRARPAGECTCDRAATENSKPATSSCSCGARPAGM